MPKKVVLVSFLIISTNNMQLDLLNQDYPSKSLDQNQSVLSNMYLEADKSKGKYQIIALPTPGLELFCTFPTSPVRALYEHSGFIYAISGNVLYRVASSGLPTALGTLQTSTGFAKIVSITGSSDTNNQLCMLDGTNFYSWTINAASGQFPILDEDCPRTASDITAQDDYIIVTNVDSIKFNICNVSDVNTWEALDFASKIGEADRLVGLISHQSKLWLFGSKTSEIWWNSGNNLFPFERVPDTFLHYGCAAKASISSNEDYILFLGRNAKGGYSVFKAQPSIAYVPLPISTQAHDSLISTFSDISSAVGYIYNKDGHSLYDLTFPTTNITFTFDISSGAISRRESYNGATYGRFLGSCQAFCYDKNLIGDYNSGNLYSQESDVYTENGTAIRRQFVSPPIYYQGKRVFIHKLQIDVETGIGANKTFTLEKSMDNGDTWLSVTTFTVPDKGGRIYSNNLGSSRYGILFRITTTMNAKFILLGFQAEISVGHN